MELKIVRPKQYADRARDYILCVDGVECATLKPNSTTTINVADDAKSIQARIDWCASQTFSLEALESDTLVVKNAWAGNVFRALLLTVYYNTFGANRYLAIESGAIKSSV